MSDDSSRPTQQRRGIMTAPGTSLTLTNIKLSIGADGSVESSMTVLLSLDMYPHWLGIAFKHLLESEQRHEEALAAPDTRGDLTLVEALEGEFSSGMQAITAAAIAIDAFYAAVKPLVGIPEDTQKAWTKNKTAREMQILEVIRYGFRLGPQSPPKIREILTDLFKYRGWAVHPPADSREPARYPEFGLMMEWRFVAFRYTNAKALVGAALSILAQLTVKAKENKPKLVEYCKAANPRIEPLVEEWERHYGLLFPREPES